MSVRSGGIRAGIENLASLLLSSHEISVLNSGIQTEIEHLPSFPIDFA